MASYREVSTTALMVIALCVLSAHCTLAQQSSSARPVPAIISYDGDMGYMLIHLSEAYDTTIGLELDPQQPNAKVKFFLRDPSLADVLNAIVQSAPKYQCRDNEGFIEVFPLAGRNPLLDTLISKFKVKEVHGQEAIDQLLKVSEVQTSMGWLNLKQQTTTGASEESGPKFSLNLENVSMREALNKIAKQSGKRFWVFRSDGQGHFSVNTSLR